MNSKGTLSAEDFESLKDSKELLSLVKEKNVSLSQQFYFDCSSLQ